MHFKLAHRFILCLSLLLPASSALADVRLPSIFSNGMVLQRDEPVPIWGWAEPGELISVGFTNQKLSATAGENGKWSVTLEPLATNSKGAQLTVTGKNTINITNILVGEVWICSGQSNMQWTVRQSMDPEKEIAAANYPLIRHFGIARATAATPQADCAGQWIATSPTTVANFTAVGYYFGRELFQKLDVPIGLINTSWGGTRSEAWTSNEALKATPAGAPILDTWDTAIKAYDSEAAKTAHAAQMEKWKTRAEKAKADGKKAPRAPRLAGDPNLSRHAPSRLYNAMVAPLTPYAIRGAIWYQGESNQGRAHQYREIFPAMISDWRKQFGQPDFPFYFVQLANFKAASTEPNIPDMWAELQEAQTLTLRKLKNTGMATINDIGEAKNIHPKNKQEVGRRLARWALAGPYKKKDVVRSGPIFRESKVEGDKIRIHFDHIGSGLKSRDGGELKRFEIAGEDKKFVWAKAVIDGDSVVVHSPEIKAPVAVRYAWAANPEGANLVNSEGLPASLFRTDDWPGATVNEKNPPIGF